jgi:hypothetical protein
MIATAIVKRAFIGFGSSSVVFTIVEAAGAIRLLAVQQARGGLSEFPCLRRFEN